MVGSYLSAHADRQNSGYVSDYFGGHRDQETFNTIWSFDTDGTLRASPVVSDEIVVIGDTAGIVYGLDAIDGRERWRTELKAPSILAAPAISGETVFISGFDDLNRAEATTYALDLSTGDIQWTRDFGQGGRTAVATDGERVYLPTYDGTYHALSTQTGETVWRLNSERYTKTPALSDAMVILGDGEDLVALTADCGTERWRATCDGNVQTPPVVDDSRVYVITQSQIQWCLDADTGEVLWHTDIGNAIRERSDIGDPLLPLGGGLLDSKPITDGRSLILGIYNGLVEIDAIDGQLLKYHPLDKRVHDPLLVATERERRLYGSVSNSGVTEFQITGDAAMQLRSTAQDTLDMVPAYVDGVFYVTTELDGIFAVT